MLDRSMIGHVVTAHEVVVERGRLRLFAKAIGEIDLVYTDESAARAAGHPSLPVPPTFLFCLEMEQPEPFAWFPLVGLDLARILHGEQTFTYYAMAYAGDTLHFDSRITDIYSKKGGALEFLVKVTRVINQQGLHIADLRSVTIQR